ncbi:MAG: septal ring lytic transglycosylase RlpA family protein [Bacteroidetes bacterium]|nr:septal ring lytic transglycosylase RlpA family protein [Bacteroidota bacterium]MBS1628872.1 septal ring lytic transglycosylase RlpA family protein [Bacteroidota bacterium]
MKKILTIALFLGFGFAATAQDNGIVAKIMKGIASYYHPKFEGRKTANGETFSNSKFTCASNKIPLNTYVKVTNLHNGKVVYVKVNDRMAANNNRLLDMTQTAAAALDYREEGLANVKMEIVPEEEGRNQVLAQREELKTTNNKL